MENTLFSCYLIGEDRLLLECADIILSNEHLILGIISPFSAAEEYCLKKDIPYFRNIKEVLPTISTANYDYLFSIINGAILPLSLLQTPRCLPINYHNSPLPKYAGLHAPSWAILNNEQRHGVSWHIMVEEIDAGDILKQTFIEIEPNETGLSLSVKCYQAAVSTFKELIYDLSHHHIRTIPQDLTQRSYYDYYKKPRHGGWINWHDSAEAIDRLCRALNLGHHYHNRLALPKFNIGEDFFIINQLNIINTPCAEAPGTLLEITADYWQVATKTLPVQLSHIVALDKEPSLGLLELADKYGLKPGVQLPTAHEKTLLEYEYLEEMHAIHERFWVQQKQQFAAAILPFQSLAMELPKRQPLKLIASIDASNFPFPEVHKHSNSISNYLFAALLIYLYRLGNEENLGVGFSHPQLHQLPENIAPLFSQVIPFSISFKKNFSVEKVLDTFFKRLSDFDKHLSFSNDIFCRYPELSSDGQFHYPITVVIGHEQSLKNQIPLLNSSVIITISNTDKIEWYCREQNENLQFIINNSSNHLPILIEGMLNKPNELIKKLPLLSPQETEQLLITWNQTQTPYPRDKSLIQLFTEQVENSPAQIALITETKQFSYQDLDNYSSLLAKHLQAEGVLSNQHIAICTAQQPHLLIGILAILKTGAAYIPIDANYPVSQIQFILNDSNTTLMLSSDAAGKKIVTCCESQKIPIVYLDNFTAADASKGNKLSCWVNRNPNDLAYIMYTSGTTGKPKGVMIPHRGINRLVKATNFIEISPTDRILQAASISFDASTLEIWGALLNGATLVAIPQSVLLNASLFGRFLEEKDISILWLTSALYNEYAAINPAMFKNLSYLLVGGDVLNAERIMNVLYCKEGTPGLMINGYGPTENTTFTTTYAIKAQKKPYQSIPIGKPVANTTAYILDEHLQPTAVGVPGELYTGGDGVGLGYWNRPELSSSRFIPNLYDKEKNSLLYKTGDMVRWLPDGNIDYLSRQDNQIKIRGFRVELEAIYATLLHHDRINQCAVRVYENEKHQKFIVAYVVFKETTEILAIQQYLMAHLPAYMIPGFFIPVEKLPLTLNGKVDFRKLPVPDFSVHALRADYVAPHSKIEKQLAQIWCDLFELSQIGIHDSFFDLGGHSLMVTQLILKVKEHFHYDLPLQVFLEKPSISHLANLVEKKDPSQIDPAAIMSHWQFDMELPTLPTFTELPAITTSPQAILLTGANGFLGANLLEQLYSLTTATIYCLIRGKDKSEAEKKFAKTIKQYQLELNDAQRVQLLAGDLEKPYLGLAIDEFMHLAEEIDLIFHNGAAVHHLYSYDLLRAANVLSVKELLKFATSSRQIPLHYISTLSAAGNYTNRFGAIMEDFIYSHPNQPPLDGYSQTKWVAEQLLAKAHQQQFPIKIYRPGWILGHSITGIITPEKNHLLMLIKGCLQLGYAPDWELTLDILPVDFISEMIVKTSLSPQIPYDLFNLVNPNKLSWQDLICYLQQRGYKISFCSSEHWQGLLLNEVTTENTLYSLLSLYINQEDKDWMKGLNNIAQAHNQNTLYAVNENKMAFPCINKRLLDIYFNFLESSGFLALK